MADNFPGPFEIEIFYTTVTRTHVQRLDCDIQGTVDPGDLPATITLQTKDLVGVNLTTAVNAWVALIAARFNVGDTIDSYNFWEYAAGTYNRTFITSDTLAVAGTDAAVANQSHQMTLTFRTAEGGGKKIVLMETVNLNEDRLVYALLGAKDKLIMDSVVASDTWHLARDTSYPIAKLNGVGGQNEAIFRSRHRQ